jgi:hypothetical protein
MSSHSADAGPASWSRVVILAVALTLAVSVIVLAFLWPALTSEPKGLPVAAAGPQAQVTQLLAGVEQRAPGVLEVQQVDDRAAAVEAIERREVYGAIVLGAQPEVLTSSAASPVAAQALAGIGAELQATVTDVVPLASTDAHGAGLASAVLPLVIGGLLGGVLSSLAIARGARRLVALALYAVLAGATVAGILQGWLGVLQGSYLANASAIALAIVGIAAAVAGLGALIGRAGLALAAITLVLVAVPLASVAAPVQFLPEPWGAVGQWFPPGAGATLLRDLSYFPKADAVFPWLVLAGWAVAGAALVLVGRRMTPAAEPATAS